jgi:hypothetical protein
MRVRVTLPVTTRVRVTLPVTVRARLPVTARVRVTRPVTARVTALAPDRHRQHRRTQPTRQGAVPRWQIAPQQMLSR